MKNISSIIEFLIFHQFNLISKEVLIDPIVRETDNVQHICWKLLVPIEEQSDLHRLLLRVLHFLHKEKCLPKRLSTALLNRASATQSLASPCWMMLSLLSTIIEVREGLGFLNSAKTLFWLLRIYFFN